jgi:hypothetical protein
VAIAMLLLSWLFVSAPKIASADHGANDKECADKQTATAPKFRAAPEEGTVVKLTPSRVDTRCSRNGVVCTLDVSNTQRSGDEVFAVVSIACTERVPTIHVKGFVSRTDGNGNFHMGDIKQKTCTAANHCNVTPTKNWVDGPNDLWHAWGDGWVEFTQSSDSRCKYEGNYLIVGFGVWLRSEQCRQHGKCTR